MRRRMVKTLMVILVVTAYVAMAVGQVERPQASGPAAVAFPEDLRQSLTTIDAQISMLIERRDRLTYEAQIKGRLGPEYERDYQRMEWRRKADDKTMTPKP